MKPSQKPASLGIQLLVVCIFCAALMPLVGSQFIVQQIGKEQRLILQWYGPARGAQINGSADRWFRGWAVGSGLMTRAIHSFDPRPAAPGADPASSQSTAAVKPLVIHDSAGRFGNLPSASASASASPSDGRPKVWYRWITAVFGLAYFALLRAATLVTWLPMLIPICVSIIVTGYTRQQLKWHGFGGVSPREYRAGSCLMSWFMGIGFAMFFVPGALPPVTVEVCLVLASLGVSLVMSNGAKPA